MTKTVKMHREWCECCGRNLTAEPVRTIRIAVTEYRICIECEEGFEHRMEFASQSPTWVRDEMAEELRRNFD